MKSKLKKKLAAAHAKAVRFEAKVKPRLTPDAKAHSRAPESAVVQVWPHVVQVHTKTTELTLERIVSTHSAEREAKIAALVARLEGEGRKVKVTHLDERGTPLNDQGNPIS